MISVDDRTGSKELAPLFKPYDVDVSLDRLDFGDFCFSGHGPGSDVLIGLERKATGDLISCMRDHRFAGYQLPGLLKTYDWVYLIVEGISRAGKSGVLENWYRRDWYPAKVGSKYVLFREVHGFLTTLQNRVGVIVTQTSNEEQTVATIMSLYKWWQKPWGQHDSFKEIYAPSDSLEVRTRGRFLVHQPSLTERVAVQLPGIGKAAFAVAKRFRTVKGIVEARPEDWADIKVETNGAQGKGSKRLGDKRAAVIWDSLRRA